MSDEMALSDNASGDDAKVNGDKASAVSAVEAEAAPAEAPAEPQEPPAGDTPAVEPSKVLEESKVQSPLPEAETEVVKDDDGTQKLGNELESQPEPVVIKDQTDAAGDAQDMQVDGAVEKRGLKRRASEAFSDEGLEFVGFDEVKQHDLSGYSKIVERLEAEVTAAGKDFTPVRNVFGTPIAPLKASKRARQDTDGSRPSSAMSSRSDGEGISNDLVASSPLNKGGRRATTEMSSPILRIPLEKGWKRELVYRAALDAHSRRNADIYYYTPQGKKLRSTREVSEHLSGTGLTIENFSFFKEPLGVEDPEKEIIRDAKLMRRVESPVSAAAPPEGKRAPKPKPPKGASPEPAAHKSPPAKIKVKSMGSRLSGSAPAPAKPASQVKKPAPAAPDNNNSAAWKKPRPPHLALAAGPAAAPPPAPPPPAAPAAPAAPRVASPPPAPPPPPPLQSRPPVVQSEPDQNRPAPARQVVQPCSLTCGRGVPSLACESCLCLYHPACAGHYRTGPQPFYCKNCRKSTSPPSEPPPLTHKSGVTTSSLASLPAPVPRRVPGPLPVPVPVPVPVPRPVRPDKRVTLRIKAASGGPEGERVWAVSGPPQQAPVQQAFVPVQVPVVAQTTPVGAGGGGAHVKGGGAGGAAGAWRLCLPASLPQSLARLNGRRFIVVPRSLLQQPHNQHSIQTDD